MRRASAAAALAMVMALCLSGCSSSHGISVSARFSDVGDLAPSAPVMMADIRIGKVTGIKLDGDQALVTMSIDPKAQVPAGVIARVRRTSLLGERVVDLQVPAGLATNAPLLRDGSFIRQTEIRPDLEDLVQSGNAVLAPISGSEVATLVDEGYKGFANNGDELRSLLDSFQTIVHGYAGHTEEIQAVIGSLNQLNGTLASQARAQGLSVANTAQALNVLNAESGRLQKAIKALARLSVGARGILDAHVDEMSDFFAQMRTILGVLKSEEGDIEGFLRYAPLHNRNTQLVEFDQFNQVLQDFVICGFNDDPNDPARSCHQ